MENLKKQRQNKKINAGGNLLSQQVSSFLSDVFSSQNAVKSTLNIQADIQSELHIQPTLTLALSGGLDSCVLLHTLANIRQSVDFNLTAHHVHHGLSVHADTWADFCQTICDQLNIPLTISTVNINPNSHSGIEAAARKARYSALISKSSGLICTAHHQDDQAETLLLQLARGAGVKGLAAMARVDYKRKLLRPLLNIPRADLESYARLNQLIWVDDESNLNQQFDRNFMRHSILPALQQQYPAIKQNLARTANHLAEANALLDELAEQDTQACITVNQPISQLYLPPLMMLSQPRINNVLRWWLAQNHVQMPSTSQLQQIAVQLLQAKSDAAIHIKLNLENIKLNSESTDNSDEKPAELTLKRYQNRAYLITGNIDNLLLNTTWENESVIHLPNQDTLFFSQKMGEGFAIKHLTNKQLVIKNRVGGERLKPDLNRPSRSLKVLLQMSGVPPWQRERLPLIFMDEMLVIVPNIGAQTNSQLVNVNLKAAADEMGLLVFWHQN